MPLLTTYIENYCPVCGEINDGYKEWDENEVEPEWWMVSCARCGHLYEFDRAGGTRD